MHSLTLSSTTEPGQSTRYETPGRFPVTYTTLITTDGTHAVYGVFQTVLTVRPDGYASVDMRHAHIIGTTSCARSAWTPLADVQAFCLATALQHATPDYPAFEWPIR